MRLQTRQVVTAGLLGAIAIILGTTNLGFIPLPTPAGSATIMHIPAIIAGIIEGPAVGFFVGLIFGLVSFMRGNAFFSDPAVAILPRIFIGIISYLAYHSLKEKPLLGTIAAAAAGTLTNTVGVLSLAVIRGYLPSWSAAGVIVATHGIPEVIVAVVLVVVVVKTLKALER
ncbi:MAG TPA: ECF transporter S component [Clostridia bacterium]|nr:ECF transporter S component [Clostridia bacterium]